MKQLGMLTRYGKGRILIPFSVVIVLLLAFFCDPGDAGLKSNRGDHAKDKTKPTKPPKKFPEDEPNPDVLVMKAHAQCMSMNPPRMGISYTGIGCVFYCEEPGLTGIDQYMETGTPCRQSSGLFSYFIGECQSDYQALIDGNGYTTCVETGEKDSKDKKKKKKHWSFY